MSMVMVSAKLEKFFQFYEWLTSGSVELKSCQNGSYPT